jgi:acyl-CoA thioesterase
MDLKKFFENDRYAAHSNIKLTEVELGCAKARMEIIPEIHHNAAHTVQGGAIFTLADFAFAAASNSHGRIALAINVSINFINPGTTGTLHAEAREISCNYRLATYLIDITDDSGKPIATFSATAYRKSESIETLIQE